ncbi:hypothetical protein [Nocardioides sp. YIM 152315]|uniref:hypothetical protein n=1 Tax=Nocardioides sp. YIM 152315 TaxID=3031760 RepID=UPI0023DAE856|nr:hypothetical protein [Nocardioides sp. YIM 152315]MDF1604937.1 hypothetical protein [Nocardioides sp. YIM 152315]
MQLRRTVRLLTAAGALVLAASALTSCGFDYATDRVYTPGAGTNDRDAGVDVLAAVVVSAEDGSGTLIATFSNNDADEQATVDTIEGEGVTVGDFDPIEITPGGYVNLADADTPITVEGDYVVGDFMSMTFTFGDGSTATLDVPSVTDCFEYAGLDATAESGTPEEECVPEAPAAEH